MLKITMTKFFLCLCLCLPVLAQSNEETPEAVAKAYLAASMAGDWKKAAALMHPEGLAMLKKMFGEAIKLDKKDEAAKELFGLKNNAEFEQLSGEAAFERLMAMLITAVPQMKEILSQSQNTILGQVAEGNDLTHILYRIQMKVEGGQLSKVDVMSLRKVGNTWRLLPSQEMEGSLNAMAQAIAERAQSNNAAKPAPGKRPVRKK